MTNEALIDALPNLVQMGLVPEEQAAQLSAGWRAAEAQLGAVNETTLGALSASLEEGREACRQGEAQYEAGRRAYLDGLRQYWRRANRSWPTVERSWRKAGQSWPTP